VYACNAEAVTRNRFFIRRLRLDAWIGVNESEKAMPQPIIVDLECALPSDLACVTDRLEHTIDYAAVVERLRSIVLSHRCELAEAMAHHMAKLIQAEFGMSWMALSITKLAPFPGAEVGVTLVCGIRSNVQAHSPPQTTHTTS
jgi:7,8-dihydroneopterin aldolase/epimerase/oxygenase